MHAGNALHSAITRGLIRSLAISFFALILLFFNAVAWGENTSAPYSPGVQLSPRTVMPDIFNGFKPRFKKQLRRLVAL